MVELNRMAGVWVLGYCIYGTLPCCYDFCIISCSQNWLEVLFLYCQCVILWYFVDTISLATCWNLWLLSQRVEQIGWHETELCWISIHLQNMTHFVSIFDKYCPRQVSHGDAFSWSCSLQAVETSCIYRLSFINSIMFHLVTAVTKVCLFLSEGYGSSKPHTLLTDLPDSQSNFVINEVDDGFTDDDCWSQSDITDLEHSEVSIIRPLFLYHRWWRAAMPLAGFAQEWGSFIAQYEECIWWSA